MHLSKRGRRVLAAAAAALPVVCLLAQPAAAAELFWDGDGAGAQGGGAGQWNTTSARFSTTAGGTVNQIWNNANADSATFNGTAGAVTLAGPITVNTITTTIGGYAIGNGNGITSAANTLNFSGAGAAINTTHTSGTTTLTAFLSGQTLTKIGAGRLELNNSSNAATNKFVLNGGALTAASPARFGAPSSLVQDFFTFNGGGFGGSTTANYDLGINRGVTIKSGGAFFGSTTSGVTITIGAPIVGTEGGGLTLNGGAAQFVGSAHTNSPVLVLTNTNNSWDGPTTVGAGSLRLGASEVIPNGSAVTLTGAMALEVNGMTETIGALSGAGGVQLNGGTIKLSGNSNAAAPNYTGNIQGAGDLVKTGPGVQELGGGNGYLGSTLIENGTLRLRGGNDRLPTGTVVTIGGAATQGKLLLGVTTIARNQEIAGLSSAGLGGSVANGASTPTGSQIATLTLNTATDFTFAGTIGGAGNNENNLVLVKQGVGTQTLGGANTYTGSTTIAAGTLRIDGGSLANGNINITGGALDGGAAGGGLTFNVAGDVSDLINLSGTGTIDIADFDLLANLTGTQTATEYVIANAIVGSANVIGTGFRSQTLPAGWSIDYDGTAANPASIVLVAVPEPGAAGLALAAGAVAGLRRRRRA